MSQPFSRYNQFYLMEDSPLNYLSNSIDAEYQYLEAIEVKKTPNEEEGLDHEEIEDQSAEVDSCDLEMVHKALQTDVFNDPTYNREASKSKTLKLNQFLPKIIEKYQEEERKRRAERLSKRREMEENLSELLRSGGNSRQQPSHLSIVSKSRKIKKQQYPTKNMLPSFKTPFLSYLSAFFPKEVFEQIPIIKRIRLKFGINLQDYELLFKEEAFRPHLRVYFRNKVIYRDLFMSRIEYKTKRIYFNKLYIFEEAFHNGVFKGIN